MWIVAELIFLGWIGLGGWWLWRRGPAGCLVGMLGVGLAYLASILVVWLGDLLIQHIVINLWLRLGIAAVLGTVTWAWVWWRWPRSASVLHLRLSTVLARRWHRRLILAGVLSLWCIGHLLAWLVLANLVAASQPEAGTAARSRSLFTYRLLGSTSEPLSDAALAEQQRGLLGIADGVDRVLAATGTRRVMETMAAITWIAGLERSERLRLIEASPELRRLTTEPTMLAVLDDARIMDLVDEAALGSLHAAYALGSEPAIIAVIDSQAMRDAVRAVDPVALRLQAKASTATLGLAWRLHTMGSSLDLDDRLADTQRWQSAGTSGLLTWSGHDRFALARTQSEAEHPVERLRFATAVPLSCWFNGRLLHPESRPNGYEVDFPAMAGEIVVMLDFTGVPPPHRCQVW